jgi:hypothetical protein
MTPDEMTPPTDPWAPGVRAVDVPISEGPTNTPLFSLSPNKTDINAHLYALFSPDFVHPFPDAWIEIAFCRPDESLNKCRHFSAFALKEAVEFAEEKNRAGYNIYVGAALRHGKQCGRANGENVLTAAHAWIDFDKEGDDERISAILEEKDLLPAIKVVTGTRPCLRAHLYFRLADPATPANLKATNTVLKTLFGSDDVQNPDRVMRLAGTVSYPSPKKIESGYVAELVTLRTVANPRPYTVDTLINLTKEAAFNPYLDFGESVAHGGRSDDELRALLEASQEPHCWHKKMRTAIASMAGKGWSESQIRFACAPYCEGGYDDPDLKPLIDGAIKKYGEPKQDTANRTNNDDTSSNQSAWKETRQPHALKLSYFGEFGDQSRKRPILKGFLNKGEISSVIAAPGRGKSALVAEIAIHCAAGEDWRNHSAVEPCGVVIFALERAGLYCRRFDAYALRDGYKGLPIAVVSKVIDLLASRCVQTIVTTVQEAEQHFGRPVGLIVFDTFSKGIAAGGGDENSAKDQNRVAANLRRVQELIDIHIAAIGHTGKDETRGVRGSNAHLGDVDVMVLITGDSKTKTAKVIKANDQEERVVAQFRLDLAATGKVDDDGQTETTAIISTEAVSSFDTGGGKLSNIQQAALDEIWNCIADGETAPRPNNVHVPVGVTGVTLATWKKRLAARGIINLDGSHREQFKRIYVTLAKFCKIGIWEEFVWAIN